MMSAYEVHTLYVYRIFPLSILGTEGRAGMAAILDEQNQIDLVTLYKDLQKSLPAYARPMFIRLLKGVVDTTGNLRILVYHAVITAK